jgi:hypothetical protein
VCIIITLIVLRYWKSDEGFENLSGRNYYLSSCPPGYKSFYGSDGTTQCCSGEIVANKCIGDLQCTLGKGNNEMPNCVSAMIKEYTEKGKELCPLTMPTYFENIAEKKKGCTNGDWNDTLTGPQTASQPTCIIYDMLPNNELAADSCLNIKIRDEFPCFGGNCTKQMVKYVDNAPPLLLINFSDSMGIPHSAYSRDTIIRYLDVVWPEWRNKGLDVSKNIIVAEVAKKFYIDKTMSQQDIQF